MRLPVEIDRYTCLPGCARMMASSYNIRCGANLTRETFLSQARALALPRQSCHNEVAGQHRSTGVGRHRESIRFSLSLLTPF